MKSKKALSHKQHFERIKGVLEKREKWSDEKMQEKLASHITQLRHFHRRHRHFWMSLENRELKDPSRRQKKAWQKAQSHLVSLDEAVKKRKFNKVEKLVLALESLAVWSKN